eukprot:569881-Pyramimonas_sp.AAC.1
MVARRRLRCDVSAWQAGLPPWAARRKHNAKRQTLEPRAYGSEARSRSAREGSAEERTKEEANTQRSEHQ